MKNLSETHIQNLTIAQAKNAHIIEKWNGKTPAQLLAKGMYVCTECRHTCSIDNAQCNNCGTPKFIISTPGTAHTPATKIFAELIYKN